MSHANSDQENVWIARYFFKQDQAQGKSAGRRMDADGAIASLAKRSRRTVCTAASGKEVKELPNVAAYVFGRLAPKWTQEAEDALEQTRLAYRDVKKGRPEAARRLLGLLFVPLRDTWAWFARHQVGKPRWSRQDWDRALILFNFHALYTGFQYYARQEGWEPFEHSLAEFADFDVDTLHDAMLRALEPEQDALWARILRFKVVNSVVLRKWQGADRADRASQRMRSDVARAGYIEAALDYLDVCPPNEDAVKNLIAVASRLNLTDRFEELRRRARRAFNTEPDLYAAPFGADDDDFDNYREWCKNQTQKEVA